MKTSKRNWEFTDIQDRTPPEAVPLCLTVRDPEVIVELHGRHSDLSREAYALAALRLGVFALRHVSRVRDGAPLRSEGSRLLSFVRGLLIGSIRDSLARVRSIASRFFDPTEPELPHRVERLLKKDCELNSLICRELDARATMTARTLLGHVRERSPLPKLLSPHDRDRLLASLTNAIETALEAERENVVAQFSFRDHDSALSRLVQDSTGALKDRMMQALDAMESEARARLTSKDESSPLFWLQRDLADVLDDAERSNATFQREVRVTARSIAAHEGSFAAASRTRAIEQAIRKTTRRAERAKAALEEDIAFIEEQVARLRRHPIT